MGKANPDPMGILTEGRTPKKKNPHYAIREADKLFPHTCSVCGAVVETPAELADSSNHE